MQIFVILAFLIVGFTVNFAVDLTVRRNRARRLREARHAARPRALPAAEAKAEAEADAESRPALGDGDVRAFAEHSRRRASELDALIDRFDHLVLRAEARARFGVAVVRVEEPRRRACELLAGWLAEAEDIYARDDDAKVERLRELALGPEPIAAVLARERERASWEFRADAAPVLRASITDLDRAVIHMQQIVRCLEARDDDPYR